MGAGLEDEVCARTASESGAYMKIGQRVSVVARRLDGVQVVVRALVRENTRIDAERDLFVCVRVLFKASKRLGDYPESLRLDDRGISWAKGWNSSAANALRVKAALT